MSYCLVHSEVSTVTNESPKPRARITQTNEIRWKECVRCEGRTRRGGRKLPMAVDVRERNAPDTRRKEPFKRIEGFNKPANTQNMYRERWTGERGLWLFKEGEGVLGGERVGSVRRLPTLHGNAIWPLRAPPGRFWNSVDTQLPSFFVRSLTLLRMFRKVRREEQDKREKKRGRLS